MSPSGAVSEAQSTTTPGYRSALRMPEFSPRLRRHHRLAEPAYVRGSSVHARSPVSVGEHSGGGRSAPALLEGSSPSAASSVATQYPCLQSPGQRLGRLVRFSNAIFWATQIDTGHQKFHHCARQRIDHGDVTMSSAAFEGVEMLAPGRGCGYRAPIPAATRPRFTTYFFFAS